MKSLIELRTAYSNYGYKGSIFGTKNWVFVFLAANLLKKTASSRRYKANNESNWSKIFSYISALYEQFDWSNALCQQFDWPKIIKY